MQNLPDPSDPRSKGHWVQTERKAHEAWADLIRKSPLAAQVMHVLTARVGENNAVVISQKNLARLVKGSERGVRNALQLLCDDNWIEIRQIGGRGTVNAHVINDRVAWSGKRDGIRYSLFSANVIISDDEQPDADEIGKQSPLRRLPMIGENQLPSGPGLPPPRNPSWRILNPRFPRRSRPPRRTSPPRSPRQSAGGTACRRRRQRNGAAWSEIPSRFWMITGIQNNAPGPR